MEFRGTQTQRDDVRIACESKADDDGQGGDDPSRERSAEPSEPAREDEDDEDDDGGQRHRPVRERFEDGMEEEEGEDDSDATVLEDDVVEDGSVDLLADCDGDEDGSNGGNAGATSVSPATRTLDRLSRFGSQEGGAELCIRLLANAAEIHKEGVVEKEEEQDGGKEVNEAKITKKEKEEEAGESDENNDSSQECSSPAAPPFERGTDNNDGNDAGSTDRSVDGKGSRAEEVPPTSSAEIRKGTRRLRDLKEYFMSTENSSRIARARSRQVEPPAVPFCRKCELRSSATTMTTTTTTTTLLPHHGLCPLHDDFFNSGSYEILNLIVDGNILGCDACKYQYENGRPDRSLVHGRGCKRGNKGGAGGKKKAKKAKHAPNGDGDGGSKQKRGPIRTKKKQKQSEWQRASSAMAGIRKGTSTRPIVLGRRASSPTASGRKGTSVLAQLTPPPTQDHCWSAASVALNPRCGRPRKGPFDVGTVVFVHPRTWPGRNDLGGVARILEVHRGGGDHDDDGNDAVTYDVKYVVEARRERGVEEEFVSLHSDYISPTKEEDGRHALGVGGESGGRDEDDGSVDVRVSRRIDASASATDAAATIPGVDGSIDESGPATDVVANAEAGNDSDRASNDEQEVDGSGHPLSEYERLRMRNIRRNQARLAQLGLLVPPNSTNNDGDGQSLSKERKANRGKVNAKKRQSREIERRTQPKRIKATRVEAGDGASTKDATETGGGGDEERSALPRASLADAARLGCKKCIAELRSGVKTRSPHDSSCPRRGPSRRGRQLGNGPEAESRRLRMQEEEEDEGHANAEGGDKNSENASATDNNYEERSAYPSLEAAAKLGCKKCIAELQSGLKKQSCHDSICPRRRGANKCGMQLVDRSLEEESGGHGGLVQQLKYQTKKLPMHGKESTSLLDAAKTGCRKCTLEWQTENVDPTKDHDARCPRARTKAPHAESTPRSQIPHEQLQNQSSQKENSSASSNRADLPTKAAKTPKPSSRIHQPTPSPVVLTRRKTVPQPPPPSSLPTWIKEFISEADRHSETVPAPRGSKWLPCANPWGKIGHEEGDFVVVSPFQSEWGGDMSSIFHQGPNGSVPERFVANPLEEGSPYHATHRSPARGGYSVLRVSRDRVCLRPWGFTVRLHEFGGACLVDSIEPLSPAEAAEDISGWTSEGSPSGLQRHDMIICINGKSVGSMAMLELQLELDVCGPELMLVVSRFDIQDADAKHSTSLEDLEMDWHDIGAGSSLKRKRVSFENDQTNRDVYELEGGSTIENEKAERLELECNVSQDGVQQLSAGGKKSISLMRKVEQPNRPAPRHLALGPKIPKSGPNFPASKSEDAESKCGLRVDSKGYSHHNLKCPHKGEPQMPNKMGSGGRDNRPGSDTPHGEKKKQSTAKKHLPVAQAEQTNDKPNASKIIGHKHNRQPTVVRHQKQIEELSNDESKVLPNVTQEKKSKINHLLKDEDGNDSTPTRACLHKGPNDYTHDESNWPHKGEPQTSNEKGGGVKGTRCGSGTQHEKKGRSIVEKCCPVAPVEQANVKPNASKIVTHKSNREPATATRYQKQLEELREDESNLLPKLAREKKRQNNHLLKDKVEDDQPSSCADEEEYEEEQDENPWLGCVCGKTHPSPIKVFWVQCECCHAWYNVAQDCIGFDEATAKELEKWSCWACAPPVAGLGL